MTAPGPGSAAPDPALVERFKAALERLWPERGKLGLAVSGGPDSLALLLLAEAAIPGRFEVATVNHQMRPESPEECAKVAQICTSRGHSCKILPVTVTGGNPQSQARWARYGALWEWVEQRGLAAVATGHHADDQTETLLMRLNRGSGVAGLAGVRERGENPIGGSPLIRPLLTFRRSELDAFVARAGLSPVNDPSNTNDRYDRSRIRKALATADWINPFAWTTSAGNLADADEALLWAAQRDLTENCTGGPDVVRYRPLGTPRAILIRAMQLIFGGFSSFPRGGEVARLFDQLDAGRGGNLAGVLATVEGEDWVFRREPARRA